MARTKRRVVVSRHSQQLKKSKTSDHISDDDAMDLDHYGVGKNLMEKLEQSKADGAVDDEDGSNNEG
eukprot:9775167-Ditylum_brightwellii.AAC.1